MHVPGFSAFPAEKALESPKNKQEGVCGLDHRLLIGSDCDVYLHSGEVTNEAVESEVSGGGN